MQWKDELGDTDSLPASAFVQLLCKQPFCSVLSSNECDIKYAALKDIMSVIGLLAQSVSGKTSIVFRMRHWDNRMVVAHPAFVWIFMWIDFSSHFRPVSGVQQMNWCGEGRGQWGEEMKANSWGGRSVTPLSLIPLCYGRSQKIHSDYVLRDHTDAGCEILVWRVPEKISKADLHVWLVYGVSKLYSIRNIFAVRVSKFNFKTAVRRHAHVKITHIPHYPLYTLGKLCSMLL